MMTMSKGIIRTIGSKDIYDILNGNINQFKEDNPLEYNELIMNSYIEFDYSAYYIINPDIECQASIGIVLSFFSKPPNEHLLDRYYWRDLEYMSGFHNHVADKFPKLLTELERIWGLVYDYVKDKFYILDRKGVTLP